MCRLRLVFVAALTAGILAWVVVPPVGALLAGNTEAVDLGSLRGSAKVNALIDQVVERQRAVSSFRTRFTQHKSSSMLLETAEADGELRFLAPDRLRWDFEHPDPMVIVVADDTVTTYHPLAGRAQKVKVSSTHRRLVGVFAGTQSLDELRSQFRITLSDPGAPAHYRLTLNPTHRAVKKKLQSLLLEVDRTLLLPVVVEYHEADGDNTRFEFTSMEINPELEEAAFHLELGDNVQVESIDASSGAG